MDPDVPEGGLGATSNLYATDLLSFDRYLADTRGKFSVFHLNVQRIPNMDKFSDLLIFLNTMEFEPDIIVLTETWITDATKHLYEMPSYGAYHCCRERPSAGISIFFKSSLCMQVISESNGGVSFVHFLVNDNSLLGESLLCTAFYMPSINDYPLLSERLDDLLSEVDSHHLMVGDFNIDMFEPRHSKCSPLLCRYSAILWIPCSELISDSSVLRKLY